MSYKYLTCFFGQHTWHWMILGGERCLFCGISKEEYKRRIKMEKPILLHKEDIRIFLVTIIVTFMLVSGFVVLMHKIEKSKQFLDINNLESKIEGLENKIKSLDGKIEGLNKIEGLEKIESLESKTNLLNNKIEEKADINHLHSYSVKVGKKVYKVE